jgi:Pyridoxamine 5'-phosphate oxidase
MLAKKKARKIREPRASRPNTPGYGLPKSRKGLLPWKWAADRLGKSRQYWVATVRPDGHPHVMPVWGLWLDGAFCFSTGSQSRKARNLRENPHCVVCNENSEEAVVVEGRAEAWRDVPAIRNFLAIYGRKYKFDMSGMAEDMLALKEPVFIVRPHTAFGLWEKKYAQTATRWQFDQPAQNKKAPSKKK